MTQNNKTALAAVQKQLEVANYKDFDKSIVDLARRGGKFQKSANKMRALKLQTMVKAESTNVLSTI